MYVVFLSAHFWPAVPQCFYIRTGVVRPAGRRSACVEVTGTLWNGLFNFHLLLSLHERWCFYISVTIKMLWSSSVTWSELGVFPNVFPLPLQIQIWSYDSEDKVVTYDIKDIYLASIKLFFVFTENKAFQCNTMLKFFRFACIYLLLRAQIQIYSSLHIAALIVVVSFDKYHKRSNEMQQHTSLNVYFIYIYVSIYTHTYIYIIYI